MRHLKGFSLVELMIVVAIIGILAAIAIPEFLTMQLKAKRSEIPINIDGIKGAQLAYEAAFDSYLSAPYNPTASLNKSRRDFDYSGGIVGWTELGWQPDGQVRGSYAAARVGTTDFLVEGFSDVDDNNDEARYSANKLTNATLDALDTDVY